MMSRRQLAALLFVLGAGITAASVFWILRGWSGKTSHQELFVEGIAFYHATYTRPGEETVEIRAVVIDPGYARFSIASQGDEEAVIPLDELAQSLDALIMINGGYFDHELQPVGLNVRAGEQVQAIDEQGSLSGVVMIDDAGAIQLVRRQDYAPASTLVEAIQAGPFLIDPGGERGIYSNDFKRAERSAIGMTENGRIVLLTTSEVTLFELAAILDSDPAAIGVGRFDRVLNLDGGPSCGLYLQSLPDETRLPENPVANGIAVWAE